MHHRRKDAPKTLAVARKSIPWITWGVPFVLLVLLSLSLGGLNVPVPLAWKLLPVAFVTGIAGMLREQAADHPLGPLLQQACKVQAILLMAGEFAGLMLTLAYPGWLLKVLAGLLLLLHLTVASRIAPQLADAAKVP